MPHTTMTLNVFAALAALLLPQQAVCDLRAAVQRDAHVVVLPTNAPLSDPLVLPLEKAGARASASGRVARGSFYLAKVSVGQPAQELRVMFDTGSGHVLLPHRACKSPACLQHRRYSPWESRTAMDVNTDGREVQPGSRLARGMVTRDGLNVSFTQADLGTGDANGVWVRDHFCLSPATCVDMALMAAVSLDDAPFLAMPNDGIVGLGFASLAAGPLGSFLGRLGEGIQNAVPQFGISLGRDGGEFYLGGHDASLTAPIVWFPVDHPEDGYWQVAIKAVRVGNITLDTCAGGCHAIVDSGASRLGVQGSQLSGLRALLASSPAPAGGCLGPELSFDLGDMVISLRPEDYTDGEACEPMLGELELDDKFRGVYAFGETVLLRYYAAFDWEAKRLGFAPTAHPSQVPTPRAAEEQVQIIV